MRKVHTGSVCLGQSQPGCSTAAVCASVNPMTGVISVLPHRSFLSTDHKYTAHIYHAIEVGNVSHRATGEHKYHAIKQRKNTINQHNCKLSLRPGLYGDDPLATVRLPQRGLSSQSLGK